MTHNSKNNPRIVPDSALKRTREINAHLKVAICFKGRQKAINSSQIEPEYALFKLAVKIFA